MGQCRPSSIPLIEAWSRSLKTQIIGLLNSSVFKHYDAVRPSVEAGKNVLVEWPLADNADRARELTDLAKKGGGPTIVGTQARLSLYVLQLNAFMSSGAIGEVINSEFRMVSKPEDGADEKSVRVGPKYSTEANYGDNPYTIQFGHRDFVIMKICFT